jgi:hypothetical protein
MDYLQSISISNCPLLLHNWYGLEVKVQSEGVEVYRFSNNHGCIPCIINEFPTCYYHKHTTMCFQIIAPMDQELCSSQM